MIDGVNNYLDIIGKFKDLDQSYTEKLDALVKENKKVTDKHDEEIRSLKEKITTLHETIIAVQREAESIKQISETRLKELESLYESLNSEYMQQKRTISKQEEQIESDRVKKVAYPILFSGGTFIVLAAISIFT